jgi:transposase-like protein
MADWHDPVREAARRAYVEGTETVKEIGQRLGISASTINRLAEAVRLAAARARGPPHLPQSDQPRRPREPDRAPLRCTVEKPQPVGEKHGR